MKAQDTQDDNPHPRVVQSSTPARFADRQWSISSPCRQPLPMALALPVAPPALPLLAATRSVAAALNHLHRVVLVTRHGLVLVVALCLARRRRRPLLDAVDALAALDAALALTCNCPPPF